MPSLNLSTVAYALLVVEDWRTAAVFIANTFCCVVIVGLTAWKRALYKTAKRLFANTHALPVPVLEAETTEGEQSRAAHPVLRVLAGGKVGLAQPR